MKIKLWPKDADTIIEKFAYCMMKIFAPALILFAQMSCWGVFKNCLAETSSHYGFGWHLFAFIQFAASVILVYGAASTSNTLVVTAASGVYLLSLTDGTQTDFIDNRLLVRDYAIYAGDTVFNRTCNPVIVNNKVYLNETNPLSMLIYGTSRIICLSDGVIPPPTPDTEVPTTPSSLSLGSVTSSSMTLNWTASTDNVEVTLYNIFYRESNGLWQSTTSTTNSKAFTGLLAATSYDFYVNASDAADNTSTNSTTISGSTLSEPAPVPIVTLMGNLVGLNTHYLMWSVSGGMTTQELQRKSKGSSYTTIYSGDPPYSYLQPSTNTTYTYRVKVNSAYYSNEVQLKSRRR